MVVIAIFFIFEELEYEPVNYL